MYKVTKKDIKLLKEKDEATFDKIWREYANILVLFIISHFNNINEEDAKDIAEQTLIKGTYCNINMYDYNKSNFATWLFSIAKNLSLDHLRKRKIYNDDNYECKVMSYDSKNAKRVLLDIKDKLNDEEFDCIVKHKYFGFTIVELAKEFNFSKSKIKYILMNAYRKIEQVKEEYYEQKNR